MKQQLEIPTDLVRVGHYVSRLDRPWLGTPFLFQGFQVSSEEEVRQLRALWIVRLNAAARVNGLSYSRFITGLKSAGVTLDRKVLADIAVRDAATFARIAEVAKAG